MTKSIVIIILPALLSAGNIGAILENHNGTSSYKVESPTQNLASKLYFPFELNTLGLIYSIDIYDFSISLQADFMLNSEATKGSDYDWHNNDLTVFSESENKIDTFNSYSLSVSKEVFENLNVTSRFLYKKMDMSWTNTVQQDYVRDETFTYQALSLKYQQDFYQFNLGMNYQTTLFDYLQLEFEPSVIYAYIEAKDSHILRNFYTMQYSQAFGYGLKANISKKIFANSKISFYYEYETYSDNDTKMYYHNSVDENYLTLPSSYKYESNLVGFKYFHMF